MGEDYQLIETLGASEFKKVEIKGDVHSIEVSASGKVKWEIWCEERKIRTGFVNFSTDTARIVRREYTNPVGIPLPFKPLTVEIINYDTQPMDVYLRVVRYDL